MPKRRFFRRKRRISAALFVILLLATFIGGAAHMGLFSKVKMETGEHGPTGVLGSEHQGTYRQIRALIQRDLPSLIAEQGFSAQCGAGAAVLSGSLKDLPRRFTHSHIGFTVADLDLAPKPPLSMAKLPRRQVLYVTTTAHPTIAAFKSYPRIRFWLKKNGKKADGPILEIYRDDGQVVIEVPLAPVDEAAKDTAKAAADKL